MAVTTLNVDTVALQINVNAWSNPQQSVAVINIAEATVNTTENSITNTINVSANFGSIINSVLSWSSVSYSYIPSTNTIVFTVVPANANYGYSSACTFAIQETSISVGDS